VLSLSRNNAGALGPINLCTITPNLPTSITISCSTTDIPNPVAGGNIPLRDTTRIYPFTNLIKFHGNNVFYLSGNAAPFTPKYGNIFSATQSMPIAVNNATGGNATFDLTKFAFSVAPATTPWCANQIAYFPSPGAPPRSYTLSTANTCVASVLKTFP
jgi:hypothetical protein